MTNYYLISSAVILINALKHVDVTNTHTQCDRHRHIVFELLKAQRRTEDVLTSDLALTLICLSTYTYRTYAVYTVLAQQHK